MTEAEEQPRTDSGADDPIGELRWELGARTRQLDQVRRDYRALTEEVITALSTSEHHMTMWGGLPFCECGLSLAGGDASGSFITHILAICHPDDPDKAGDEEQEGTGVKMPFEKLMEYVADLSDTDKALPMGKLAERWGEPVQRIGDAIDAVRVLNGERTYITVNVPAPESPKACEGFRWIGQPWASCDGCGRPAWEHKGMSVLKEGSGPFGGDMDWEVRPWAPGEAEHIRARNDPRPAR